MSRLQVDVRIQTVCLFTLTLVALLGALYWLRPVLIPFVLALFFTYALAPIVDLLTVRARLPRWLAIPVTLALGAALLVGVGMLITSSVRQLLRNATVYQERFAGLVDAASATLERYGLDAGAEALRAQLAALPIGDVLALVANALLDTLSNSFLVLIFSLYLLFGYRRAPRGPETLRSTIEQRIQRYIVAKIALSAATGLLVGLVLYGLGVDLALVFGVLAFLLNFIPNIGSIVATLLPLPVLLMGDGGPTTVFLGLLLPTLVQVTLGNLLEPRIMGDALDLHPVTILLALILWGVIWGIPGMFLATPITAVLKILLATLDFTRPLSLLMGGRVDELWAGLPVSPGVPGSGEGAP